MPLFGRTVTLPPAGSFPPEGGVELSAGVLAAPLRTNRGELEQADRTQQSTIPTTQTDAVGLEIVIHLFPTNEIDDFLDFLRLAFPANEHGIFRGYDNQILDPNGGDDLLPGVNEVVPGVPCDDGSPESISFAVRFGEADNLVPGTDITPSEIPFCNIDVPCFFHDTIVDGDPPHETIRLFKGGLVAGRSNGRFKNLELFRELREMYLEFLQDRLRLPDERSIVSARKKNIPLFQRKSPLSTNLSAVSEVGFSANVLTRKIPSPRYGLFDSSSEN